MSQLKHHKYSQQQQPQHQPSQQNPDSAVLNELFDYFDENHIFYDDYDVESISSSANRRDNNDSSSTNYINLSQHCDYELNLAHLSKFCTIHLNKCSFVLLIKKSLFKNLSYLIFSNVNCLLMKLAEEPNEPLLEKQTLDYFNCIDLLYAYLVAQQQQQQQQQTAQIKFETIDLFVLSTLNCINNISKYSSSGLFTQQLANALTSNRYLIELISKSNGILNKLYQLVETRIDFQSATDVNSVKYQLRMCRFALNIIKKLKDAKTVVILWKILAKLIIKNQLLQETSTQLQAHVQIQLKSQSKANLNQQSDQNLKIEKKQLIYESFRCLFESLYSDIWLLCNSLNKLALNETQIDENLVTISNTQITSSNNLLQDTVKRIKLVAFLFKIFKCIVQTFKTELSTMSDEELSEEESGKTRKEEFYSAITSLFALINHIVLSESSLKLDDFIVNEDDEQQNGTRFCLNKNYMLAKNEFLKEFMGNFDSLLQIFEQNDEYIQFWTDCESNKFLERLSVQCHQDEPNANEIKFSVEQLVLFQSVFLARLDSNRFENSNDMIKHFETLFKLIEFCFVPIRLPNYCLQFESTPSLTDLSKLFSSQSFRFVEFYDVILSNLHKFIQTQRSSLNDPDVLVHFLLYSLLSNNATQSSTNKLANDQTDFSAFNSGFQALLCYDLLFLEAQADLKCNELALINTFFQFYEILATSTAQLDLFSCNNLRSLLLNLFANLKSESLLNSIEEHLMANKQILCYSLVCGERALKWSDVFKTNLAIKLTETFQEFIDLIQQQSLQQKPKSTGVQSANADQMWMKKLLVFIDKKEMFCMLEMYSNMAKYKNTNGVSNEMNDKLLAIVSQFFRLNEPLDALFKYMNSLNAHKQLNSPFKSLFLLICETIKLQSTLNFADQGDLSNQQTLLFMLNFFHKHLQKSSELLNFKLSVSFYLSSLASKELKDKEISCKLIDLFIILLNDSNCCVKFFTFQCLNEFLLRDTNNKIIIDVLKQSNTDLKAMIGNFIQKVPFNANQNDADLLAERAQLEYNKRMNKLKSCHDQPNYEQTSTTLDETMCVLMSGMDTTISVQSQKLNNNDLDEDDENALLSQSDAECAFEKVDSGLKSLLAFYKRQAKPVWMKNKFRSILDSISNSI